MFIARVQSKGKNGKNYVSVLLRESKRIGDKVVSKTIAVLTEMPGWLITVVERAVKDGKGADSLQQIAERPDSPLGMRQAESFGALCLVHEIARSCSIVKALGSTDEAKLALWQVLARVLSPATSLLGMVRLAGSCAATCLLGIRESFTEDDLYANGGWIAECQTRVEAKLWQLRPEKAGADKSLFFYDVTSSYFEGQQNALAEFGYNRDKIKGKKQVVMGLLTDSDGEPMSVSLFPGNTNDLGTFATQVNSLKHIFKQESITLVGDRGMIRGPQQKEVNAAGFNYISALHKAEIETLLKSGEVQLGFFDNVVHETLLKDGRRLVTRCNPIRREELAATHRGFKAKMDAWVKAANTYLMEHPKARESTQLRQGTQRLKRGRLDAWVSLQVSERRLSLVEDEEKLKEHAKLDGCYAIVSDLTTTKADAQTLHDRYKDLSKVESDFRTLKHGHLEIRPWHVRSEDNTRAHAFTAMLALKIRRRLQQAWEPLNMTVEEGLTELAKLCVIEIYDKTSGRSVSRHLPDPSTIQAQLLGAAGVTLPKNLPAAGPDVVTRVKLQDRRKTRKKP